MRDDAEKTVLKDEERSVNGKDEMNLVDFPFATLNHKDSRAYIECVTWHSDREKRRYQQTWIVSGNSRLGLPHEIADQIVIALLLIWSEQGGQKTFSPTIYRLLKVLGLPDTKHYYELLKKTLLQLDGLRFRSERAFWDNHKRQHVSIESFGLFDSLRMAFCVDGDSITDEEGGNYIEWSTPIWKSLMAGYLKNIDLSFYLKLHRPLTRRLYRFLDKQLYYRGSFEIDIFALASRLGMQNYLYPSKIKEKLKPAVEELTECGFLASVEFVKVGKYTRIRFVKATRQKVIEQLEPELAVTSTQAEEEAPTPTDEWQEVHKRYGVSKENQELWSKVLENIKVHVPLATFYSFVERTLLLSIEDGIATILIDNPNVLDWLQNRFTKQFRDELNYYLRHDGKQLVSSVKIEAMDEQRG